MLKTCECFVGGLWCDSVTYDDELWDVCERSQGREKFLRYSARNKDKNIIIKKPEGMYHCYSTFADFNGSALDLSQFDTSDVVDMTCMFDSCGQLTSLDLSNFDTRKVRSMRDMFHGCDAVKSIKLGSKFITSNVVNMQSMFCGCKKLESIKFGGKFITSNVVDMSRMFCACNKLESIPFLSQFDTRNVTSMCGMFGGCSSLSHVDVSCFDTSSVETMYRMFSDCSSLSCIDVSNFDTTGLMYMCGMFERCKSLKEVDLSSFNTRGIKDLIGVFEGCSSLKKANLSSFDTSNVERMDSMFAGCKSLVSLDVSNFNTSNVINMSCMFAGCESLSDIDLSSFDTSNLRSMKDFGKGSAFGENTASVGFSLTEKECSDREIERVRGIIEKDSLTKGLLSKFSNRIEVAGMGTKYMQTLPDHIRSYVYYEMDSDEEFVSVMRNVLAPKGYNTLIDMYKSEGDCGTFGQTLVCRKLDTAFDMSMYHKLAQENLISLNIQYESDCWYDGPIVCACNVIGNDEDKCGAKSGDAYLFRYSEDEPIEITNILKSPVEKIKKLAPELPWDRVDFVDCIVGFPSGCDYHKIMKAVGFDYYIGITPCSDCNIIATSCYPECGWIVSVILVPKKDIDFRDYVVEIPKVDKGVVDLTIDT